MVRVEGGDFELPIKSEDRVEVDRVMQNMKIFDITYNKKSGKILIVAEVEGAKAYTFMLRGIYPPQKKRKKVPPKTRKGKPQTEKKR